jgi:hypothetical protein
MLGLGLLRNARLDHCEDLGDTGRILPTTRSDWHAAAWARREDYKLRKKSISALLTSFERSCCVQ